MDLIWKFELLEEKDSEKFCSTNISLDSLGVFRFSNSIFSSGIWSVLMKILMGELSQCFLPSLPSNSIELIPCLSWSSWFFLRREKTESLVGLFSLFTFLVSLSFMA